MKNVRDWRLTGRVGSTCFIHFDMWRNKPDIFPLNKEFICVAYVIYVLNHLGGVFTIFPFAHSRRWTRDCDVCVCFQNSTGLLRHTVGYRIRPPWLRFYFSMWMWDIDPGSGKQFSLFYDNTSGCWLKQVNIFFIKSLLCWFCHFPGN